MALEKTPRVGDVVLLKQGSIGVIRDDGAIDSDEESKYFGIEVIGQENDGNHGVVAQDFTSIISPEALLEKLAISYDILNDQFVKKADYESLLKQNDELQAKITETNDEIKKNQLNIAQMKEEEDSLQKKIVEIDGKIEQIKNKESKTEEEKEMNQFEKPDDDVLCNLHDELWEKVAEECGKTQNIAQMKEEEDRLQSEIDENEEIKTEEEEVKDFETIVYSPNTLSSPKPKQQMSMRQLTNTMKRMSTMGRNSTMTKLKKTPSMMRSASQRFITDVGNEDGALDPMSPLDEPNEQKSANKIFEYGFGEPFSYWKDYDYYPFVAPKYKDLKEELLQNKIRVVAVEDWDNTAYKASMQHQNIQNVLGAAGDTNTPYARYNEHFNKVFGIPFKTLISEKHIMSILFYTDLTELPRSMKAICRRQSAEETNESFMKRHSELANWLRLMLETILLYGNSYNKGNIKVYHGLNRKFYFNQFKAKFATPTSTTTDLNVALTFAEDNGIILELGPMESCTNDSYFDTKSLSEFPDEQEYLFFWAELPIKAIYTAGGNGRFDMAPLSLYQSIVSGNIIIDKDLTDVGNKKLSKKKFQNAQKVLDKFLSEIEEEQKETASEDHQYGYDLLKRYITNCKKVRINKEEIIDKVGSKKLRKHFIEQNDDKSFKAYSESFTKLLAMSNLTVDNIGVSKRFKWTNTVDELKSFVETGNLASGVFKMKDADKARFYAQLDILHESEEKKHGHVSLVLWKLKKGVLSKTVSFDVYCKQLNKFYVRFNDVEMKTNETQGGNFDFDLIQKAIENEQEIEWMINIMVE